MEMSSVATTCLGKVALCHTFLPEAIMLSLPFLRNETSLCLAITDAGLKRSSSKLRLTFSI